MPTRIVLNTNPVPSQLSPKRGYPHIHRTKQQHDGNRNNNNIAVTTTEGTPAQNCPCVSTTASSRRTTSSSGFRSSILRELSVRQDYNSPNTNNKQQKEEEQGRVRLSSGDIRASPRFLGYLFAAIAGSVLLVSVVQFYDKKFLSNEERIDIYNNSTFDQDQFFITASGDLIYRWKLWGAIYGTAGLVGICLLVMLVHYDTCCLPRVWVAVFRDGSLAERNLILFLGLLWACAIHINTSSLSVGSVQANVYFTTWIAFASVSLTYGVWRESAGLNTITDIMNQHKRETTYNWGWTLVFSVVFAGAATDIYYNRDEIELRYQGEVVALQQKNWILVLTLIWADVALCIAAIALNEYCVGSAKLPCSCKRGKKIYRCALGWRKIEGLAMLAEIGAKFYVIWEYTGVDGVVNGLSNAYFGIWGSFFNSVFAFGTWLKEKQNTEYIVEDGDNRVGDAGRTEEAA